VALEVRRRDLRVGEVPVADTVAANLLRPLLVGLAGRLAGDSPLPSALLASGLLVGEADEVSSAFASVGLVEARRRSCGEWAALLLLAGGEALRRGQPATTNLGHRADGGGGVAAHPWRHAANTRTRRR
jgi:hypothetical protein